MCSFFCTLISYLFVVELYNLSLFSLIGDVKIKETLEVLQDSGGINQNKVFILLVNHVIRDSHHLVFLSEREKK